LGNMTSLKISFNDDLRRIKVPNPESLEYIDLLALICSTFQIPQDKKVNIHYFDGEDNCIISSTNELLEAFSISKISGAVLKLVISLQQDKKEENTKIPKGVHACTQMGQKKKKMQRLQKDFGLLENLDSIAPIIFSYLSFCI